MAQGIYGTQTGNKLEVRNSFVNTAVELNITRTRLTEKPAKHTGKNGTLLDATINTLDIAGHIYKDGEPIFDRNGNVREFEFKSINIGKYIITPDGPECVNEKKVAHALSLFSSLHYFANERQEMIPVLGDSTWTAWVDGQKVGNAPCKGIVSLHDKPVTIVLKEHWDTRKKCIDIETHVSKNRDEEYTENHVWVYNWYDAEDCFVPKYKKYEIVGAYSDEQLSKKEIEKGSDDPVDIQKQCDRLEENGVYTPTLEQYYVSVIHAYKNNLEYRKVDKEEINSRLMDVALSPSVDIEKHETLQEIFGGNNPL